MTTLFTELMQCCKGNMCTNFREIGDRSSVDKGLDCKSADYTDDLLQMCPEQLWKFDQRDLCQTFQKQLPICVLDARQLIRGNSQAK